MPGCRRNVLLIAMACLSAIPAWANPPAGIRVSSEAARSIPDFTLPDQHGTPHSLHDVADSKLIVVAFLGTQCPLAKLYAGRLQEMSTRYPRQEVAFLGVISNAQDSLAEIAAFVRAHQISFPVLKDLDARVADQFQAERTPQVFLLDAQRVVRYQGRVDDQYLVGVVRDHAQRADLQLAIEELQAGQPVSVPTTPTLGCLIGRTRAPNADSPVTYSRQIARIFRDHCVECHRAGEIGPFPMTSYNDVAGWGPMIAEVVAERRMPPWHADPHFGTFLNDTSLTAEECEQIATWVQNGCPEGNPAELPEPKTYLDGWQLAREPDIIIPMGKKPFQVPKEAGPEGVRYQQFWVETGFDQDRWIRGMEVRPGNRQVVHHVIVYAYPEGKKTKKHDFIAAYVPGLRLSELPAGAAKRIAAGSWLRFEVHYTPNGTPQEDLTSVGFVFADPQEITHEVKTIYVGSNEFEIQPRQANQTFTARSPELPAGLQLVSFSPHMHLRGQSFDYVAHYPDGREEVLLKVPKYDFNWQTRYCLKTLKSIPQGTVIECHATFDNSPQNLANPNPDAVVRWGDQSWDEMFLGYLDIMYPAATQAKKVGLPPGMTAPALLKILDRDGNGFVSQAEAKPVPLLDMHFERVDQNHDGQVSESELKAAIDKMSAMK